MRTGEKVIIATMLVSVVSFGTYRALTAPEQIADDPGIPYFSTADAETTSEAAHLMHKYKCKHCHSLWGNRDLFQSVPAPPLDGIGHFRSEQWLYDYFSAAVPQDILPTRLKTEYRQPSFADLPEQSRRTLAKYMASLQVEDWYLEETKKRRFEKLTGKPYVPEKENP